MTLSGKYALAVSLNCMTFTAQLVIFYMIFDGEMLTLHDIKNKNHFNFQGARSESTYDSVQSVQVLLTYLHIQRVYTNKPFQCHI